MINYELGVFGINDVLLDDFFVFIEVNYEYFVMWCYDFGDVLFV